MAILAECPSCHKKQSCRNKICSCSENLDRAKNSKRVRYWIQFRLPDGRQRKEYVSTSINEARDAEGKRRSQKRENRIFDMLPESKITFSQLSEWYEGLKSRQRLASFDRIQLSLKNFNDVFGEYTVNSISLTDLENYQDERADKGKKPATIDQELSNVKTMVTRAFYDDKISGRPLKAFSRLNKKLKKGANARKRIITIQEYLLLIDCAEIHLKAFIEWLSQETGYKSRVNYSDAQYFNLSEKAACFLTLGLADVSLNDIWSNGGDFYAGYGLYGGIGQPADGGCEHRS